MKILESTPRKVVRTILKITGAAGIVMFLFLSMNLYWLLGISFSAFFLGMTDFGRQCPLLLSIQHYRAKRKIRSSSNAE